MARLSPNITSSVGAGGSVVAYDSEENLTPLINEAQEVAQQVDRIREIAENTWRESPWLAERFPEMVDAGTLAVRNGDILLNGLSLDNLVAMAVGTVSVVILVWNTLQDQVLKNKKKRLLDQGQLPDNE